MTTIALEGIHLNAFHGFYEEEQLLGNEFILDVYFHTDTSKATEEDDLFATVNYEMVYHICLAEMKKKSKLIETVAQRIVDRLKDQFENIEGIKVRLRKLNPPLGGKVDSAMVEIVSGTFDIPSEKDLKKIQDLEL